jgi:hypothetical protein
LIVAVEELLETGIDFGGDFGVGFAEEFGEEIARDRSGGDGDGKSQQRYGAQDCHSERGEKSRCASAGDRRLGFFAALLMNSPVCHSERSEESSECSIVLLKAKIQLDSSLRSE